MRAAVLPVLGLLLAACVPEGPEAPKGPPIEIVEAFRAVDTTRVVLRYRDGSPIAPDDENRAVLRAMEIACREGENPIADTRTMAEGLLTVRVFCVGVLETDMVVDGSRLRT